MASGLRRLLKSYEFLKQAHSTHAGRLTDSDALDLRKNIDRLFLDILRYGADDPSVTIAQIRFLLTSLAELTSDPAAGEALRAACEHHLDRLGRQVVPSIAAASARKRPEYRYLDSLTDRIGILDANYRYVFTNTANAAFHGKAASEFAGVPNWRIVGSHYFDACNKPRFDACLAGRSSAFVAPDPFGKPGTLFSVKIEPVREDNGDIGAIMVTCRDVSALSIPRDMIAPLP